MGEQNGSDGMGLIGLIAFPEMGSGIARAAAFFFSKVLPFPAVFSYLKARFTRDWCWRVVMIFYPFALLTCIFFGTVGLDSFFDPHPLQDLFGGPGATVATVFEFFGQIVCVYFGVFVLTGILDRGVVYITGRDPGREHSRIHLYGGVISTVVGFLGIFFGASHGLSAQHVPHSYVMHYFAVCRSLLECLPLPDHLWSRIFPGGDLVDADGD